MGETSLVIRDNENQQVTLQIDEIRKFIAPTATEQEFWLFINTARSLNLNPIKRELYFVKYGDKASIITGYEVYIKRANLSKLLEWWKVEIQKPSTDFKTWIGVFTAKRKDWTQEFTWEVPMIECFKSSEKPTPWTIMKEFMLKKVTIGQGMRLLIPEVLAGMPYMAEERDSLVIESEYSVLEEDEKIEPTDEELKAKDQARLDAIQAIQSRINKCDSIEKLDKLYTLDKINASELKVEIETMLAERRRALIILKLAELTNINYLEIKEFVNDEMIASAMIQEALSGNEEAIKQLGLDINSFLKAKLETVDETDGLGDGEAELNI
jgi:hypothetical protein